MAKADTLALTQTFSNQTCNTDTINRLYDDVMFELAREDWFVDASIIALTKGQQQVDLGAAIGMQHVTTLGVIYDDTELEETPLRLMEALDPQWRDSVRYTRSYVIEDESSKVIALHPAPFVVSNPDLGSFGEPLGADLPTYNLACFYSYAATEPWQPWYYLELVIALRVLSLEFNRESDHFDPDFAKAAQTLSDLCKGILA